MRRGDLLWLAGLLEGEGCFSLDKRSANVQLHMTDRDVVVKAARLLDRPVRRFHSADARARGWRPVYYVKLSGNPAKAIMSVLLPLMGERRTRRIRQILKEAA